MTALFFYFISERDYFFNSFLFGFFYNALKVFTSGVMNDNMIGIMNDNNQ